MIKQIAIYDMDGTIVCSAHRYRTAPCGSRIDLEHWRKNDIPEQIARDSLLPMAAQYKADLRNPTVFVIIATARACIKNDANYQYIIKHLGKPNRFVHRRGPEDYRGGAELKLQAIVPLLNLRQFQNVAVKVYEDNISYLKKMCDRLDAIGIYVPSVQGH